MKSSYLIQRLNSPPRRVAQIDNPFSFGGGLRNGGLSEEAMGLLRSIFSFDYMGAAEFEWGAVPKALNQIAAASLVSFEVPTPVGIVYVIAPGDCRDEVERRVDAFASTEPPRTMEWVGLRDALTSDDPRTRGWLEIDNGYFFFVDAEMHAKTAALFGIEAKSDA